MAEEKAVASDQNEVSREGLILHSAGEKLKVASGSMLASMFFSVMDFTSQQQLEEERCTVVHSVRDFSGLAPIAGESVILGKDQWIISWQPGSKKGKDGAGIRPSNPEVIDGLS